MFEETAHILPIPERQVDRRRVDQVDLDRMHAREIAGPIFDAGLTKVALAQRLKSHNNLNCNSTHWFHLILQGRMRFRFDRDTVVAEPGDLVCVPAGVTTSKTALGPVVWLYVEITDTQMWTPLKALGPSLRKYESTDLMYILVSKIVEAARSRDVYSIRCAFESSQMLVTLLKREIGQVANERTLDRKARLVALLDKIREHPQRQWESSTMAHMVNMSVRNLGRVFQRTFNMPPARMVMSIRMDLAIQMLIKTDMSITEIANAVGYDSPFSFSRFFKKHLGVAPGQYRTGKREPARSTTGC